MAISLELMPLADPIPEAPLPKTMVVRYGYLRQIGEFPSDIQQKIGCGSKVVVRTERGTEIGEMLTTTCSNGGCGKSITRDKMLEYFAASGGKDYPFAEAGRVLRVATAQDMAEQAKLDEQKQTQLNLAREQVVKLELPMKIVDVEPLLGGERVMFYFVSEQRVDFRTLVRELAHHLHTRIELRQVGARDEARITADYEKCGQHCCCKQFLKVLTPISMRSAKTQKATLDPSKISGRCGRLMCCLRYEDETYEELKKKLPKRNTRVRTEQGEAWVVDGQILTQLVMVQYDDGKRAAVPMEQIQAFDLPKPKNSDGRVMQSPNDRPMEERMQMQAGGRRPPRAGGPPPRGPQQPNGQQPNGQQPQNGQPETGPEGAAPEGAAQQNQPGNGPQQGGNPQPPRPRGPMQQQGNRPPRPQGNRPPRPDNRGPRPQQQQQRGPQNQTSMPPQNQASMPMQNQAQMPAQNQSPATSQNQPPMPAENQPLMPAQTPPPAAPQNQAPTPTPNQPPVPPAESSAPAPQPEPPKPAPDATAPPTPPEA